MFKSLFNFLFGNKEPTIVEQESVEVAPELAPIVEEAPKKLPSASKLNAMSKAGLEALGREFGVELDKRKSKKNMIEELKSSVSA